MRTLFSGLLAAGLCIASATAAQPDANMGADANWAAVGGGVDEANYSRLTDITTGNAAKLGLAWSLDLPGEITLEATPLAVDGVLYFSGGYGRAYAVDGVTGKLLWKFDPEAWKTHPDKARSFGANRGMAYEDGKVFVAAIDGRLFALDAKTGKTIWMQETIAQGLGNTSSGAPRVMNGKVIIGNAGADFGARGFVTAYDSATGKFLWRFYTAPGSPEENKGDPVMEMIAKTWTGEWWKVGTGGTVWNGMTFDPETNRIYLGVGNAGPYDPKIRTPGGGDNLFITSIVALDADTGKYLWHYQENQRDSWDYKAAPNIVMATIPIDGKPRKVLLHAPTNGFFYVLDRETGKLISAGKTTLITWAKGIDLKTGRPIEEPNIRYETGTTDIWPSSIGGHDWQAMAYSPLSGLAYIPIQQLGMRFTHGKQADNAFNIMGLMVQPIAKYKNDGKGKLVAWDPVTQKQRWAIQYQTLWNGGVLATAGHVVFQGTADGWFIAYDDRTGKQLWRFYAGHGIMAAPMSFTAGGKQYVSVLSGYGGTTAALGNFMNVGWKFGQPRRLLTFALDATGKLPSTAQPDFKVNALDDPDLTINQADVDAGQQVFGRCAACHGIGLQAVGGPGPDLRESSIALKLDTFSDFVKSGNLFAQGMPRFDKLTDQQLFQLHAYIRAGAREALGLRKTDNMTAP